MKKSAISLFIILLIMLTACSQNNIAPATTAESSLSAMASAVESHTADPTGSEPSATVTIDPTEKPSPAMTFEPTEEATSSAANPPTSKPAETPKPDKAPSVSTPPAQTETPPVTPPPTSPPEVTEPPVSIEPTPKSFNINDWTTLAKNYGESIGLIYDVETTGSWDTPIAAGPTLKSTGSSIKDRLSRYKSDGIQYFCVWAEARTDGSGKYDIYIGYA